MGRTTRRPRDDSSNDTSTGDTNLNSISRGCTPSDEVPKQYLETTILGSVAAEYKLREIVENQDGIDHNEWLAYHTISFFDQVNVLYGCVSEFCTMSGCPEMTGPGNRQYLWIDEKGKRVKLPAPQYIDYALTFTQKTVNDESIFPTKCDTLSLRFPERTFESHVKQIIRLMFNVLAHIYHGHFKEIAQLSLHTHLNCLFSHLVIFNDTFKLVTEEKDLETLLDDVYSINTSYFDNQPAPAASRLLPPPPLSSSSSSSSPSNSSSQVQQQQQNLHLQSSEGGGGSDKKHDELQA